MDIVSRGTDLTLGHGTIISDVSNDIDILMVIVQKSEFI